MASIRENYMPGDFIACTGDLRKGKTMNAFRLARALFRKGYRVRSNVPFHFGPMADRQPVLYLDEFVELTDCVFVWDEIQASLDSRLSKSQTVIKLTQESILIGKRGIILIYTSPALSMVDIRYRMLTRNIYQMTNKALLRSHGYVTRVEWLHHVHGQDGVTMPIGVFPLVHKRFYGTYDTLWGRRPGESVVIRERQEAGAGQAKRGPASTAA
jgi:hypothetical protein